MIVFTGEALIDFIPVRDSSGHRAYQPAPGGSVYNTSIASARLDVPTAFFGGISRDFFGDRLAVNLEENGVSSGMVQRFDAPSTLAFVDKTPSGEARYAFFATHAADRQLRVKDIPALNDDVAALAFGSIALIGDPAGATILSLIEKEHVSGKRVISFDPNIRESLITDSSGYRQRVERGIAAATILKISDEDLRWISGTDDIATAAQALLQKGPALVVVTAGSNGSTGFFGDQSCSTPAERTTVVDTIGAGDSFHAAILAWLHHSRRLSRESIASLTVAEVQAMLRFASAVAAKTCGRAGADPPRLSEVQTRFRSWG